MNGKNHVLILAPGTEHEAWKSKWPEVLTKNGDPHEVPLAHESLEIVRWAWENRRLDSDYLFHANGKPLGPMPSELKRTGQALGIPYGRGKGIVFHDTGHMAITSFTDAGVPEAVGMTISGHKDPKVYKDYNVRRTAAQANALRAPARQDAADHRAPRQRAEGEQEAAVG